MKKYLEDHWQNVYDKKNENEVSWYQKSPKLSLEFVKSLNLSLDAEIIDIGAGESRLVDNLLEMGFVNLSVLDISSKSIEKTKKRLGLKSKLVNWIVSDINNFNPTKKYDLWHDRAAFHFLKDSVEIDNYVKLVKSSLHNQGNLIIATFSENGPLKCSGLEVSRYSENSISDLFNNDFELIKSQKSIHKTPFSTSQEFLFSKFKKK
ncbi:nodulation S family protein [Flavobacteriaceae bacterium]|jgi:2-polyprenyl-3-methyl-5-hydroxy-6-metoxy-1,4-benzoquinol methylase|nr:nodulation S family protein [Flavobacteriaceae bacterium]|tara:strand:- start:2727 stop:3344 length:618 start_codon:yes stop_codon:yes gene_type:complete